MNRRIVRLIVWGVALIAAVWLTVHYGSAAGWFTRASNMPNFIAPEGFTLVPMTVQRIPAYSKVRSEHIVNPQTGMVNLVPVRLDAFADPVVTDVGQLVGRVVRHDKEPGKVFLEKELFPRGTLAGDAAAVPPGKRAMSIEVSSLSGARGLKPGDHVDIVSVTNEEVAAASSGTAKTGKHAHDLVISSRDLEEMQQDAATVKHAASRVVVLDGLVITPVIARGVPYDGFSGGMAPSAQQKMRTVEELMIAVEPEEVVKVTNALAEKRMLMCVLRSGQPATQEERQIQSDPPAAVPVRPAAATKPETPPTVVETIVGKHHDHIAFHPPETQP